MSHSPENEYLELEFNNDMAHQWRKLPECSGFVGNARSKHTIVAYDSCIYVFGGNDGSNKMLNDVLVFDTNKMSWSRACNNSSLNEYNFNSYPECRYNHSAVVNKHSMFIFGGYIDRESVYANCNDLYEYQFLRASWIKWETSGTKPAPRSAHGCAVYDDKLWIFAGYDGKSRLNDMWQLPLNSYCKSWKEVQQYGDCPPTCCNFASTVVRDTLYDTFLKSIS